MTIKKLSDDIIAIIAAGEVIDKPAYVLKELLENSCDANSTEIFIYIENAGLGVIKVVDNGDGICKESLCTSLMQYTTDKLYNISDLRRIGTYGFRGEALYVISAVSLFIILSKISSNSFAWKIVRKANVISDVVLASCKKGTTIIVRDLFDRFLVKRTFFLNRAGELKSLLYAFKCIALVQFNIHFILFNENKEIKNLPICNNFFSKLKRLEILCGSKFFSNAIYIGTEIIDIKLYGLIISTEFAKSFIDCKFIFLNGRSINNIIIQSAIKNAYIKVCGVKCNVGYCLYIYMDYKLYDVNVHPKKNLVRFMDDDYIYDYIYKSVVRILLSDKYIIANKVNYEVNNCTNDIIGSKDDYFILSNNNYHVEMYIPKDKFLTIQDNKVMYFELNGIVYIVSLFILKRRIILYCCINNFIRNKGFPSYVLKAPVCLHVRNIDCMLKVANLLILYGFNIDYIKCDIISINSIPVVLCGLLINWKLLFEALISFFYNNLNNNDLNVYCNSYIVFLFIKYIYYDVYYQYDDINLLYTYIVKFSKVDIKWFNKYCFKINYNRVCK